MNEYGGLAVYSNNGASLLISAPAGEWGPENITTTDIDGTIYGYNGLDSAGDYTDDFNGTSAAAPMVAGVAALVLSANQDLGWRDVKEILARSAAYTGTKDGVSSSNAQEDWSWGINGAMNWNGGGLHYSQDYGFGRVQAEAAVALAQTWFLDGSSAQTSSNEQSTTVSMTGGVTAADDSLLSITFDVTADFEVNHAQLYLDWSNSDYASNWTVTLISPNSTSYILAHPEHAMLGEYFGGSFYDIETIIGFGRTDWTFGAEGFLGEKSSGTWTLNIQDSNDGRILADSNDFSILDADLTLTGTAASTNTTYYYTDEYATMLAEDAGRASIVDSDGGTDTLNAAAVTSDIMIDLTPGATNGGLFVIDAGTTLENAIGGSGNDSVTGNTANNKFWGREGSDTIDGGAGDDWLSGGYGNDLLTGGTGADTFSFTFASGIDFITDFEVGTDTIELVGYGLDSADVFDLLSFDGSGNAQFNDGGTQIIFSGIDALAGVEDSFVLIA